MKLNSLSKSNKNIAFYIFLFLAYLPIAHSQETSKRWQNTLNSANSLPRLYSLLVSRDGEIVLEKYFNGKKATDIANIKSASKSVVSALVGIAIDREFMSGVDQNISSFFTKELNGNTEKSKITVGNLLSMQSGLESTSNRNYGAWVLSQDWIRFALEQPFYDEPDGLMIYSTGNTHLLATAVARSSELNALDFARKYLFSPMETYLGAWPKDPQGNYFGGNDMELTPRQMLAFGELYLNQGRYKNKQVISSEWISESLKQRVASPRGQGRHYGYGWWIRDTAGFETPYAWGYGGQFILLVPEENIVVVVTSSSIPGPQRRFHTRAAYRLVESAVIEATQ
ncbi:serine hydrolase domain-containing protein [Aurantivibrio infirmus]